MKPLRYTLVADGSSDRALLPIINWSLDRAVKGSNQSYLSQFASKSSGAKSTDLADRIARAVIEFPSDLILVHRDAERQSPGDRLIEINQAMAKLKPNLRYSHVPIVPVRMTEAWLLIDELAIRTAADNPNGSTSINSAFDKTP